MRSARTSANRRAPAARAAGTYTSAAARRAPYRHPSPQKPERTQPCALIFNADALHPSARAPSSSRRLGGECASSGTTRVCVSSSMRSNTGARSAGRIPTVPCAAAHSSSTQSGVRSITSQLTVVLPPTARPCSMGCARSSVARAPASAYRRWVSSASRSVNWLCRQNAPSSSSTTSCPASARRAAATAPPAPLPITHTSARTRVSPRRRAPSMMLLRVGSPESRSSCGRMEMTRAVRPPSVRATGSASDEAPGSGPSHATSGVRVCSGPR